MDVRKKILFLLLLSSSSFHTTSGFYFLRVEFHELEGYVISVERVDDEFECIMKCGQSYRCKSVNYALKPGADGLHECVLLRYRPTKGKNGPRKPSQNFHYYYNEDEGDENSKNRVVLRFIRGKLGKLLGESISRSSGNDVWNHPALFLAAMTSRTQQMKDV